MPEQLLGRLIRACSNPGEVVLDPFAGSGTTLVVAKKLGRRWIGFELSPNYASQIQARLEAAAEGQPLEGAEEPKLSAPRTPFPPDARRTGSVGSSAPQRSEPDEINRGIIEAFFAVRKGLSADRVIADPELNSDFMRMCQRLGVPGYASEWNRQLMNLRKAGYLAGLPRSQTSSFSREQIDRWSYACEIALQHLRENGATLDQVLCDPAQAAEFDRYVQSMISEEVSSFKIRWVALHIRKRAKKIRQAGRELAAFQTLPRASTTVPSVNWDAIPGTPGLYWLQSPQKKLYVGETLDLRQRFKLQLETSAFGFWDTDRRHLELRYCELPHVDDRLLKANQSRWIARWKPVGNYQEFAAL
jgi:site-specific DNA-methyltransferase (adenine-specific)